MKLKRLFKDRSHHERAGQWLRPKVEAFGRRHRLSARTQLANRLARRHPKVLFVSVTGILLLVLCADMMMSRHLRERQAPISMSVPTLSVEPMFRGFRTIQANKEEHIATERMLTGRALAVKSELDSLMKLKDKTHADSMSIARDYRQLESIVQTLNIQNNEIEDQF